MEEKEKKKLVKEEKRNNKGKSLAYRITNIVLWVIVIAWMGICVVDFIKVQNEEEPIFCLKNKTIEYDDGNVYVCTGVGYKVYNYKRKSFEAIEFGPFWLKDRSNEESK